MLELKLLGSPQILLHSQPVSGLSAAKSQALLFYLAVTGRPQSRLALAGLLWPDKREVDALANLRQALYRLRNALPDYLAINRLTVAFNAALPCVVDAVLFEQEVGATNALVTQQAAVDRYSGEFLAGFYVDEAEPFEAWAVVIRERLHRLATEALQKLVAHFGACQEITFGLRYANQWLAHEPWREEAHCAKMQFLAWNGQPQAALDHYERCRQLLMDELGVAPAADTVQLIEQIRRGQLARVTTAKALAVSEAVAEASKPEGTPPTPTVPAVPRRRVTLPAEVTGFVGREREITQAQQRLADPACRLLTITGLGGVGKTRLALRIGHRLAHRQRHEQPHPFPDGIYFVPLAAFDPHPHLEHLLATTLATALQIPLAAEATPTAQLLQALAEQDLLLILDNCEHLPVAGFINQLLQQTRCVKLLVTARTRLNVRGEQLIRLAGLATPAATLPAASADEDLLRLQGHSAVRLFVQSIQSILPDFTLGPTTAAPVTQICQLLHGLPLGLELAATWAQLLPLPEIVQEIRHNLDFLEAAQLEAPPHQRSLRAVFNHSWQLLTTAEQQVLRRLAVFRGGFTREAAAQVAGATLGLLAQLTDKSLVQRIDSAEETPGSAQTRYELQPVVQQYADEQLRQAGETVAYQARHAAYLAHFLAEQRADLASVQQQVALRRIHTEIENVRAAWQWLLAHLQSTQTDLAQIAEQVSQGFDSLFHFYDMRSWFQEGEALFGQLAQQLVAVAELDDTLGRLQANAQARQGWFACQLGRYAESRQLLTASLQRLQQLQAEPDTIFNLNYLGALHRHTGEFAQATTHLQTARRLAEQHRDPMGMSIALNILGQIALLQGELAAAQQFCRQALQIKRTLGDQWGMTFSLGYLGRAAQYGGEYAAAQKLFAECLTIARDLGDQRGAAFALQCLGDTAYAAGDLAAAQARYQESLSFYRAISNRYESSVTLARLGDTWRAAGDRSQARQVLCEALALAWSLPSTPGLLAALLGLAMLALDNHQPEGAAPALRFVAQHAGSSQQQRQQATQLLAAMSALATDDSTWDLTTYVQTILSEG
ncbi:MAG: AfsR/SARP family transcriptional regulator [Caldilineaceae bacterium]